VKEKGREEVGSREEGAAAPMAYSLFNRGRMKGGLP